MHVIQTARDGIAGIEVIANSTSQIDGKGEVLALRIFHPFRSIGVDKSEAGASIDERRDSPVRADKVASKTHQVSAIVCFRPSRN